MSGKNFRPLFLMSGKNVFHSPPPPHPQHCREKQWPEIKICCRASSVLAGQFWQTPPELKGASFAPACQLNVFALLVPSLLNCRTIKSCWANNLVASCQQFSSLADHRGVRLHFPAAWFVDNLLQGCRAQHTCYKLFQQLVIALQFNNLSTSCEWLNYLIK
jgi:hypothetical protein